jgi:hypothetical protein
MAVDVSIRLITLNWGYWEHPQALLPRIKGTLTLDHLYHPPPSR